MQQHQVLELVFGQRLSSVYETSANVIYTFEKLKVVNNILTVFVQKIDGNNVENLRFPISYFQNEFVHYVELEKVSENVVIEESLVEEVVTKKLSKK